MLFIRPKPVLSEQFTRPPLWRRNVTALPRGSIDRTVFCTTAKRSSLHDAGKNVVKSRAFCEATNVEVPGSECTSSETRNPYRTKPPSPRWWCVFSTAARVSKRMRPQAFVRLTYYIKRFLSFIYKKKKKIYMYSTSSVPSVF